MNSDSISVEQETAPVAADQPAITTSRRWYRAWGIPFLAILLLGGPLVWLRLFYTDPLWGTAMINLLTVVFGGLLLMTLMVWFCFLSYYSRATVLSVLVPLVVISGGWAASIKLVQFDGDMNLTFFYRWQPDRELQKVDTAMLADGENEVFEIGPTDVPGYRGNTERNGIFPAYRLNEDWQANPPRELWRTTVGAGYASMSLVGKRLITLEQRGDNEAITCYQADNGQLMWIYEYPARFFEAMGGLGPRSTPTIDDGQVFVAGALGDAVCVDFFTGKKIWQRNLLQDYAIPNITWATTSSPLVIGQHVLFNVGGPQGDSLVCLNRQTGESIWEAAGVKSFPADSQNYAGYSSPVLMTVDGIEQIVIFDGDGLSGHDPANGKLLWHFQHKNDAGVNVAQPILLASGNEIFISASYGNGSALVKVTHQGEEWRAEQVWKYENVMRSKYGNPVIYNDFIYGLDEGILQCVDPQTGEKKWKNGRYKHGQLLLTGERLLIMAEDGDLVLVAARPDQFEEITRMTVLPAARVWNQPVIRDGIVYVRDEYYMAAYDLNLDAAAGQ